jgi:spermidine synthase
MKKWTTVDTAPMPDGTTMSLIEHDGDWFVRVDGGELMSTRRHASEEKLAELACARLANKRGARVLIGGLGFGFTLKAALAALPSDASVTMAEIQPAVVAWNRNPLYPLAAEALKDPRVQVLEKDVVQVIRELPDTFDAILLDVDNGPAALSTSGNRDLYSFEGLRRAHAALRPGGCAAFWSAAPDAAFEKLLARADFQVEVHRCRALPRSGSWHTLFIGRTNPVRF